MPARYWSGVLRSKKTRLESLTVPADSDGAEVLCAAGAVAGSGAAGPVAVARLVDGVWTAATTTNAAKPRVAAPTAASLADPHDSDLIVAPAIEATVAGGARWESAAVAAASSGGTAWTV